MAKGSKEDPYSMSEYDNMVEKGTWKGGYVKDDSGNVTYTMGTVVVNGYSSGSGSGKGSDFQFGSYKSFSGDPNLGDDDDDDDDDDNKNKGNGDDGNDKPSGGTGGTGGLGGGGNSGGGSTTTSTNTLVVGSHTEVSSYSQNILRGLKGKYGRIVITSTLRSPEKQASIMLENTKTKGVDYQLALYGKYGDAVIRAYNPNASDEENLQAMTAEVYKQGPRNVSKHCMTIEEYQKLNVIDISRTQMTNPDLFVKEINSLQKNITIFNETKNRCIHLEIPQP